MNLQITYLVAFFGHTDATETNVVEVYNPNIFAMYVNSPCIWASLIAGLEYGMDQWNGKWNGTVIIHNYN